MTDNGIYTIKSEKKGPTTTIMGGVHGNEKDGITVIKKLIRSLKIHTGTVFIILANIEANKKNKRFVEKDMNRCFFNNNLGNTYEENRVREILPYLEKSDYLLDLHSSNNSSSKPFLISEHYNIAKYFPTDIIASGFDILHPGGSDGYMNSIGKIGLCLESGSIYDKNTTILYDSVMNFLKYTGNIHTTPKTFIKNKKYIICNKIYKNIYGEFTLSKNFGDFDGIKKGNIIGYDGTKKIVVDKNSVIVFAHNRKKMLSECFVLGNEI